MICNFYACHTLVAGYYVFTAGWDVRVLSAHPSDMIPVSEADEGSNSKIPSNISVAMNLC